MPEKKNILEYLLFTLQTVPFDFPIEIDDLIHFLCTDGDVFTRNDTMIGLDVVSRTGKWIIDHGEIFPAGSDVQLLHKQKQERVKLVREAVRAAGEDFSWMRKQKGVSAVMVDTDTRRAHQSDFLLPIYVYADISRQKKIERALSLRLFLRRKIHAYDIQFRDYTLLDIAPHDAPTAYQFLQLRPLINIGKWYEKVIHQNSWIFSLFPHYPFQKVSREFKVLNVREE